MVFLKTFRAGMLPALVSAVLALFLSWSSEPCSAATDSTIEVCNRRVTLHVQGTPLGDVLTRIAKKAGFAFVIYGSLDDPVSLDLIGIPLEEALDRLLAGLNFSYLYENDGTSSSQGRPPALAKVIVFSGRTSGGTVRFEPRDEVEEVSPPPEPKPVFQQQPVDPVAPPAEIHHETLTEPDEAPKYGSGVFVKAERVDLPVLKEEAGAALAAGISVTLRLGGDAESEAGSEAGNPADRRGVRIAQMPKGNALASLGLKSGDVIQDINGVRITEPGQASEELQKALDQEGGGLVRIEEERGNVIEPIYVEMN